MEACSSVLKCNICSYRVPEYQSARVPEYQSIRVPKYQSTRAPEPRAPEYQSTRVQRERDRVQYREELEDRLA